MKIIFAVFSGSLIAALFALLVGWMLVPLTGVPTLQAAAAGAPGLPLLVTAVALILGAVVATKIHASVETMSGYATVQLFFGPALIREFWLGDAPWYSVVALVIVLPLTFLGALLGSRRGMTDRLGLS